jgi:dTDP-4-amino-4,6-dideoxygalactose transaminase
MNGLKIPFTGLKKQYLNLRSEIIEVTDQVYSSGYLMDGNHTLEFEKWLSERNGCKYAITCHSGTQALEIIAAYYARKLKSETPPRALIPTLTYVATANAFIRTGWNVTLVDTDNYGIIDLNSITQNLDIQATIVVGLYGAVPKHNLYYGSSIFIEDAAQHWLGNDGLRLGDAAAISFDPMKNLSNYGNGGAVVTNELGLIEFARQWRNNGKSTHRETGTNSRMSEIDCAQMMIKTKYIDEWQKRRCEIAKYWISRLKDASIRTLIDDNNFHCHSFHKFVIDLDHRDIVKENLDLHDIETKIHYKYPLHELPAYAHLDAPDKSSVAIDLCRRVLSLPIYPELTDIEVEYVIDSVIDCASQR